MYAIGDIAAALDGKGGVLPQLAPVAIQGGHHVGPPDPRPARGPADRRRSATATRARWPRSAATTASPSSPAHIRLSGFPGWLAWLGLHLVLLIGFRNRANVLVNWAWNYLTYDRGARLILE